MSRYHPHPHKLKKYALMLTHQEITCLLLLFLQPMTYREIKEVTNWDSVKAKDFLSKFEKKGLIGEES